MAYQTPIPSATGGIEFGRLSSEDVKKLSVKRIHVTPTLDSMFGPMPGGVHDLALGAINVLDANCSTCRMNAANCPGHCGHIELPQQCYHPQYMDTTLRLLRAKCIYCHHFRLTPNLVHYTICRLRLLHHGLVNDFLDLARFRISSKRKRPEGEEADLEGIGAEEDTDVLMERRERFVNRCIKKAQKRAQLHQPFSQNSIAQQSRKDVITDFLQQVAMVKKCARCTGISPSYRKDKNTKIFRMPLPVRAREEMRVTDRRAPNPLIYLMQERQEKGLAKKPVSSGEKDVEMADVSHGAEEEIALRNALETSASSKNADLEGGFDVQTYMTPAEVHAALSLLFEREQQIMSLLFAPFPGRQHVPAAADIFFMTNVLVTPNKFRPLARQGANQMMEAQMNSGLNKVINAANNLKSMMRNAKKDDTDVRKPTHAQFMTAGIALQETVNALIDNPPPPNGRPVDQGIKQVLEKKEGLFRMNMMGKRVNFAARSVISPDPNIETNEIGVPLVFAKKLTYPEPVGNHNFEALSRAVINGCDEYPGAAAIENEHGQVMSLKRKSKEQRRALAKQLLSSNTPGIKGDTGKKVYRHLITGDVVIMNRQPTLHKPSMMGHRARVLQNEKTIRMHYANCNTYNADFDGDEMNMHFPQNELARAEALNIADTDHQYLSATAGKPLRGLIQDHISMGVQFTSRDVFFDREQYQELLYNCLRPETGRMMYDKIQLVQPAILKPKMLWSGKQVITTVLKNIVPSNLEGLNLTSKSQTASERWGEATLRPEDQSKWSVGDGLMSHRDTEQVVIFKDGEHLSGILDKAQLGPSAGGLVHSVYEIYGHIAAGKLLSVLGQLLTRFLHERAWSCGMDDLYLTPEADELRRKELEVAPEVGHEVSVGYVQLNEKTRQGSQELIERLEDVLRNDDQLNTLDQLYNAGTKKITDAVARVAMPNGLRKPFPRNQMQAMTTSGAKGSGVNANLISCNLGQQVLEGRRVPVMVSGKTLPLYRAFETHPTAGGFVTGRFLTGIKPPEYFFHAMSGREGLIDTAVKTAKSGYLQRCIIKGLEGLRTEYDTSVREASNGTIVQFLYGEDGLEVTKQKHLKEFSFLVENHKAIATQMAAQENISHLNERNVTNFQKKVLKSLRKGGVPLDPLTSEYPPANYLGSTSEAFSDAVTKYSKKNPDNLLKDKSSEVGYMSKKSFENLMNFKYMRSVIDAGEAIGVVAAQSVGEPSTQMTLNTFHLAGHSAKNVTLGIPRLREIIMTASPNLMTPTMTIKPDPLLTEEDARQFAKAISRLPLSHVIDKMSVTERPGAVEGGEKQRTYEIKIEFYDPAEYTQEYAIQIGDIARALELRFLPLLYKRLQIEFKKKEKESSLSQATAAVPEIGASVGRVEEEQRHGFRTSEREGGEDDIDSDVDPDDAKDMAARARREDDFDEPDDDEAELAKSSDEEDGDGDTEMTNAESIKKRKKIPQTLREQNPNDSGDNKSEDEDSANDTEDLDSEEETSREAREKVLKETVKSLTRYDFSLRKGRKARITLSYDANSPKLLLLPILEQCAHAAVVQAIPGLKMCTLFLEGVLGPDGKILKEMNPETGKEQDVKEKIITTQGVNLLAMRAEECQKVINPHTIRTNSPHDMLKYYGVEACRMTIIQEIAAVFGGHGISVDNRHINLIADAMTQSGGYKAFSRHGIVKESGSILAKMSFETVMGFLKEAVMFGEGDNLRGPSARIVAGRRGNIGTGAFDVVMPV
ncbi:hypothetical protein H2198_003179 [Neophaeococcomyces mojaviensis]|uniref:Uncharacterized protein n=1 Tax=Neophaeococcomyces mojaviensis TaxID=3383035 RepID=A0ACC3AC67_9EURO|nr:hypothetical protein H2198_003179 [Knufia sp. JES_112]